jgi:hypothetical protein
MQDNKQQITPEMQKAIIMFVLFIVVAGIAAMAEHHGMHVDTEAMHHMLPAE